MKHLILPSTDNRFECWSKHFMNYYCSYSLLLIFFLSVHTVVSEEKNQFLKKNQCQFPSLSACLWLTVYGTSAMEIMILFFWLHYHSFLTIWKCCWGLLWNRLWDLSSLKLVQITPTLSFLCRVYNPSILKLVWSSAVRKNKTQSHKLAMWTFLSVYWV